MHYSLRKNKKCPSCVNERPVGSISGHFKDINNAYRECQSLDSGYKNTGCSDCEVEVVRID